MGTMMTGTMRASLIMRVFWCVKYLQVSLSQLLNTHVPTVWAIDQYRIYKEVSKFKILRHKP